MKELTLNKDLSSRISELYSGMEKIYDQVAKELNFSCRGCQDNCCDSYFQHYTYIEWAYLWEGIRSLPEEVVNRIMERAKTYIIESEKMLARGERPCHMCPLNENGLCVLYSHRLMICRLHGVPASFTRPDDRKVSFPGCFRCQDLLKLQGDTPPNGPEMDRTDFFRRMVKLEVDLLGSRRSMAPKVKLTLAQMLAQGPPHIP